MTNIYGIVHPIKKEFHREKCAFDHMPAHDFVKSQWQRRTKSVVYLIYRWLITLLFVIAVIVSMEEHFKTYNFWIYFVYMTNWGIITCCCTNLLAAILVTIWHYHPNYAEKLINMESLASPFRIYWAMHIISLVISICVSIIYWSFLYKGSSDLSAANIFTHILNSMFMFIDLWVVAHPLRLLHIFLPVLFGAVYAVFTFVYYLCGGMNRKGKPYIYPILDWHKPMSAFCTVFAVLLLSACVYFFLFTLYKVRSILYKRIFESSFVLPTTATKSATNSKTLSDNVTVSNPNGTGIQHSPSGISMVLSNYEGYKNQAFAISAEHINKC